MFNTIYDYLFLASGFPGAGRHIWNVSADELPILLKVGHAPRTKLFVPTIGQFSWAISNVYCPTIWLAKSALLFQLMHIFTPTKTGPIFWAIHVLIWGNFVFYLCTWVSVIAECVPSSKIWHPERVDGHCININASYAATGSINVISDFLILLLPFIAIARLQMNLKRKFGIAAVFATGFL